MQWKGGRGKRKNTGVHGMPLSPPKKKKDSKDGGEVEESDDEVVDENTEMNGDDEEKQSEKEKDVIQEELPLECVEEEDYDEEVMETPTREGTIASSIITATKGPGLSEQFLMQEKKQGNATNWEFERKNVEFYVRWTVFEIVKFPTRDMMEFSLPTIGMSKAELLQQEGMISRLVIKKFATNKSDKEKWWNMVKVKIMMTFVKRRSAVTEGIKKVYEGKLDWTTS